MSEGAGDHYKGYYIRTVARPVNHPRDGMTVLFEGSATVSLDPASRFHPVPAEQHLGDDQVFGTEFEAHRYAEKVAKRYIDKLEKGK
ncbi:hypothetical protein CDO44_14120 [Pigmentiphaga sp. NML080357]|uniref:hypothetical protein n=1 Tax=Pigmentiphaga sp. NML080357 TaxID=2008675 RepID=UPI000B40B9CF|nr:hypothetical protein [Pigmentiphaga sp. NML080357]OVZ58831.1 hypothetical protein CDO44_14120 [Pigmentiphaga sp. NML080357]